VIITHYELIRLWSDFNPSKMLGFKFPDEEISNF